jgi:intracellular septation protein
VRNLIFDLLSGLLFMVVLLATKNIYAALIVSLIVAITQIIWSAAKKQEISTIQWASFGLVILAGAASLGTHDARFIKIKPAVLELCVGVAMLRRNWIERYVSASTIKHLPASAVVGMGYIYAFAMLALAAANASFALTATQEAWAVFNGIAPPIVFSVIGAILYLAVRHMVRASMRKTAGGDGRTG